MAFLGGMHQHDGAMDAQRRLGEVRAARIAAGRDVARVAERSRIPVSLIEEFEGGDLSRWPRARYGRTQLVRYARAAALDPDWVVSTVSPLLDKRQADGRSAAGPVAAASGRIAIIASSFDPTEELFASEDTPAVAPIARHASPGVAATREAPAEPVRAVRRPALSGERRPSERWMRGGVALGAAAAALILSGRRAWVRTGVAGGFPGTAPECGHSADS